MNYTSKHYEENNTEVIISSFKGKGGVTEYHLLISVTASFLPFPTQLENVQKTYARVVAEEPIQKAIPVFRRYFLSDSANQANLVMEREYKNPFCAMSVVQQAPLNGTKIALWAYLQTDIRTETCNSGMFAVSHNGYRHLWNGGDSNNVDVNYAGVVKARKELFVTQNLTEETHYISSTGIEGRHADPNVLVQMDAYSVDGLQPGQIQFLYAPTHLNPTHEYGVTFERGTAVTYGDRKQIFISGTASIDNQGEIVYPGDILKQTERMLENISILLREAGAEMSDIMQAIVYLRDPADYKEVALYIRAHYSKLPYLLVLAPVCRPGWLIETECIAVISAEAPQYASF